MDSGLMVLALPAIVGTVNLLKELGAAGKLLTLLSVVVGLIFTLAAQLLPDGVGRILFIGVLGGLGAAGFYDVAKLIGGLTTSVTTTRQVSPSTQVATTVSEVKPQ